MILLLNIKQYSFILIKISHSGLRVDSHVRMINRMKKQNVEISDSWGVG